MKTSHILYGTKFNIDISLLENNNHQEHIKYASKHLEIIGKGSSRIAFKVMIDDHPTVLKIAKNYSGYQQNIVESNFLSKQEVIDSKLFIPILDHHHNWIHQEYANPITKDIFKKFFGIDCYSLIKHIDDYNNRQSNIYCKKLYECYDRFKNEICFNDVSRIDNWGIYEDMPVILDIGITKNLYERVI